jgi:hypothetical protein
MARVKLSPSLARSPTGASSVPTTLATAHDPPGLANAVVLENVLLLLSRVDRRRLRLVSRNARRVCDFATRKLEITWEKEKREGVEASRLADVLSARSRLANVTSLALKHLPTDVLLVALSPVLGSPAFEALRSLRVEMVRPHAGMAHAARVLCTARRAPPSPLRRPALCACRHTATACLCMPLPLPVHARAHRL